MEMPLNAREQLLIVPPSILRYQKMLLWWLKSCYQCLPDSIFTKKA